MRTFFWESRSLQTLQNKMIKPSLKKQVCMQNCYNKQFYYV